MRLARTVALLYTTAWACTPEASPQASPSAVPVDYGVYRSVLRARGITARGEFKLLRDARALAEFIDLARFSEQIPHGVDTLLARTLSAQAFAPFRPSLVSSAEGSTQSAPIYELSRVAFTADSSVAWVYLGSHCPLCGAGILYRLTATADGWIVGSEVFLWAS